MNYKKTPILGDSKYKKKVTKFKKINLDFKKILNKLDGQSLHAKTLGFTHPSKNKYLNLIQIYRKILKIP